MQAASRAAAARGVPSAAAALLRSAPAGPSCRPAAALAAGWGVGDRPVSTAAPRSLRRSCRRTLPVQAGRGFSELLSLREDKKK
jgi:hypothetical protein